MGEKTYLLADPKNGGMKRRADFAWLRTVRDLVDAGNTPWYHVLQLQHVGNPPKMKCEPILDRGA
jgi:hypothetical protein